MTKHEVIRMIADLKKVDIAGAQELLDALLEKAVAAEDTADFNEFFKEEARSNPLFTRILDRRMEMLQQGETEEGADDEADGEDEADEEAADEADDDSDDEDADEGADEDTADEDDIDETDEALEYARRLRPEEHWNVIMEENFSDRLEYLKAVLEAIEHCLKMEKISAFREDWVRGVSGFSFQRSCGRKNINVCACVDLNSCTVSIEYTLPFCAEKSRALLVKHMMMQRNAAMPCGVFICDEDAGVQKLVCGYSVLGAFSRLAFLRYLKYMDTTVEDALPRIYQCSTGKLTAEQRNMIRTMIGDLRSAL